MAAMQKVTCDNKVQRDLDVWKESSSLRCLRPSGVKLNLSSLYEQRGQLTKNSWRHCLIQPMLSMDKMPYAKAPPNIPEAGAATMYLKKLMLSINQTEAWAARPYQGIRKTSSERVYQLSHIHQYLLLTE